MRSLLFVDLAQSHRPGWWLVVATPSRFMEAESLEGSRKREKEQRGRDEDANVEMDQA